ncbi:MAG: hypothetical protein J0H15_13620 [Xanthomonadales bacterium]|nr:hypothetical protein [Xanthomonadales bacterium]
MRQPDAHETWRVAAGNLHWIALGLVGSLALVVAGMYWFAQPLLRSARELAVPPEPPAPRLQPAPLADLAALRAREEAQLEGYGWIDQDRGIARIPIQRAMSIIATRSADRQSSTNDTPGQKAEQPAAPQPDGEHEP